MPLDFSALLAALSGAGAGIANFRQDTRDRQRQSLLDLISLENLRRQQDLADAQLENYRRDNTRQEELAKNQLVTRAYDRLTPQISPGGGLPTQTGTQISPDAARIFQDANLPLIAGLVRSADIVPGQTGTGTEGLFKNLPTTTLAQPVNVQNDLARPPSGAERSQYITEARTLEDVVRKRQGEFRAQQALTRAQSDPASLTPQEIADIKQFAGVSLDDLLGPTGQVVPGLVGGKPAQTLVNTRTGTATPITVGPDRQPFAPIPPASAAAQGRFTRGQQFNATRQLRQEFDKAIAPIVTIGRQVEVLRSALDAAKTDDRNRAAAAQAVLVTYQKILDPTSVVRESEYARSAEGQALLDRLQGIYETYLKGGVYGVPLDQLERFAQVAEAFGSQAGRSYIDQVKARLSAVALDYDLNPEQIFIDPFSFAGSNTPAPPPGATVLTFDDPRLQ